MITLLLFVVLCNRSPHCVIPSLSQLPGSHRWCLHFYPVYFPRISTSPGPFTASWLSHTYPIMLLSCTQHWLFNFPLSATILWALSCSCLEQVCLLAVCVLRWGNGRWRASFCVHIIRRETMPKHFRERGASWWECHWQRQRCNTPAKIIKTYGLKSPRTLMCTQSRLKGNISN